MKTLPGFCLTLLSGLAMGQTATEKTIYTHDSLIVPEGEVLEVAGMAFLNENVLLASTRRGRVWWIENPLAEDPADAQFHIFAEGLFEGLGMRVVDGEIFVVQRGELSKLVDLDGDKVCDRIETISQAWGMTGNYHEFAFGLPVDGDGHFYVSANVGFSQPEWWLGDSREPYRGWILRIAPNGQATPWAMGVRSPAGLGQDSRGNIFYTDNQGDWMPVCGLFRVRQGEFYGHPASLRWTEKYQASGEIPDMIQPPVEERTPPALWIPYEWSRSTGSVVEDMSGGKFGPFGGQLFLAELTNGAVIRAALEEVDGHLQGACMPFRQDVGSAFRVVFAPDGTLFTGRTNRGWGGLSPGSGIGRIRWTGEVPLEVSKVALKGDGFEVGFTQELETLPEPGQIHVYDYDYNYWWDYGSPVQRREELEVERVAAVDGGLRITVPGLRAGRCVRVRFEGIGLLHEEFDYTIHKMPGDREVTHVAKVAEPPEVSENPEDGWLTLTWQDPFDAFVSEGWELVNADLDPGDRSKFVVTPGNNALVNTDYLKTGQCADFVSKSEFGDIEFRFAFMLPEGGDSGLYFMGRYELQLQDDPGSCCGIVGVKGPRARGYRGPGDWHVVTGKFYAPRFDAEGNKLRDARFEQVQVDGVTVMQSAECEKPTGGAISQVEVPMGPLRFQGGAGLVAMGDIRVKRIVEGEDVFDGGGWTALAEWEPGGEPEPAFEVKGRMSVSDQGTSALWLGSSGHLVIDHTSSNPARTGSLLGFQEPREPGPLEDVFGQVRTQLLQPGIPFDLRLTCEPLAETGYSDIRVWLNGIQINWIRTPDQPKLSDLRLEPERVPGTELEVEELLVRPLAR